MTDFIPCKTIDVITYKCPICSLSKLAKSSFLVVVSVFNIKLDDNPHITLGYKIYTIKFHYIF